MGEIKSVKVDNWGVFFLQKLQNFFNKTDYCDLTLQFNDNSQLKVHRLVLSACTDYFNVLEQTCEMIEDILIMPPELQADVVVPIVNFMYTGTLEFELKMYGRLLKTAKDMNMTVLLKLLEAHRRTMEGNKPQANANKIAQKNIRRIPFTAVKTEERHYSNQSTAKASPRRAVNTPQQYKTLQIKPVNTKLYPATNLPETAQILTKYPHSKTTVKGPSRFDCNEDALPPETFEKSFDNISYESKPLICKEDPDAFDYDNLIRKHETYSSTFEQLRRGYTNNNNKRPLSSASSYDSPPEKKPNIQDVKEYAEQQRVRKQIAEEFDEEQDFDEIVDDEFHNDDDDDDYVPPQHIRKQFKQKPKKVVTPPSQPKATKPADKSPTFVVKDSTTSNVNHAKIISEVLRKYPHLVKNTKNIKLKIMPQSNNSQKIVIKKDEVEPEEPPESKPQMKTSTPLAKPIASKAPAPSAPPSGQPRRIDSKTMHSLIAQGAENRTGPWLCLRCGINGRPISIPSYRGFRRHLINVHKEKIDPRLCEHCGWRSTNNRELAFHSLIDHSIKPPSMYSFPACVYCSKVHLDESSLSAHIDEKHVVAKKNKQSCVYCDKGFKDEMQMYNHMREAHRERAIEDGILDESDADDMSFDEEMDVEENPSKIKIISNISLPKNIPVISTDSATKISTAGSDILSSDLMETDSSQGPKFVSPDGNEMDLTPAQREEIISQLSSTHEGVVMVLNEAPFDSAESVENLGANEQMVVTSEQMEGNSMFIVCGQEPEVEGQQSGSKDPLSWAGEESQEHVETTEKGKENKEEEGKEGDKEKSDEVVDPSDGQTEQIDDDDDKKNDKPTSLSKKAISESNDSIEMKLKLLTDWTDDDEEGEEHAKQPESESIADTSKENVDSGNKEQLLFETLAGVEDDDTNKMEQDETEVKSEQNISENVPADTEKKDAELDESIESTENEDKKNISDKSVDEETIDEEKSVKHEELEEEEEDHQDVEEKIKELTEGDTGDEAEKVTIKSSEAGQSNSKDKRKGETLITKAELRNIMDDWGEEGDDDSDDNEEI